MDKNKGKAENAEDGEDKRGKIKEGKQQAVVAKLGLLHPIPSSMVDHKVTPKVN